MIVGVVKVPDVLPGIDLPRTTAVKTLRPKLLPATGDAPPAPGGAVTVASTGVVVPVAVARRTIPPVENVW